MAAEKRAKNSMSMHASIPRRRTPRIAWNAPRTIEAGVRVATVMTFCGGTSPTRSTTKRFSSKQRKYTLSRPTLSHASLTASWARTVEPCSASLRKRIRRTWAGGAPWNSPSALRTWVRSQQRGAPTHRSIHWRVRASLLNRFTVESGGGWEGNGLAQGRPRRRVKCSPRPARGGPKTPWGPGACAGSGVWGCEIPGKRRSVFLSSANTIATGQQIQPTMPFGQRGLIAMRKAPPSTLAGPQVFPRWKPAEATWNR